MREYLHSLCRELDPDEVSKLMTNKKHKARKKIIKYFLIKTYWNKFENIQNKKELLILKNTYSMCKIIFPFCIMFSFFSYKYFFTGVYEFREFYLNSKNIPATFKIFFSASICYWIFTGLWINYAYNEDIYEMAVRDYLAKKTIQSKNVI
jgi:hypothetical protein